jgi:uncharacterized protein
MREGYFADLKMQFVAPLRWIVREKLLQTAWETVQLGFGRFVEVGTPTVKVGVLTTTATVPVQFRRAELALSISMTSSGRLVGLRIRPQSLAGLGHPWTAPSYADIDLFKEEEMRLGKGWYKVGGTLSIPNAVGRHPCIVMIGGSGPCDRDSTVGATKPFKDLAWGLASRGIGVLRFDKVTYVWQVVSGQ